ncbi:MAG TPA: class I SAM-dependent methyltransferase [Solirubrobacteraceae bacterium]|jgi:SAM-dependent methyltransferase
MPTLPAGPDPSPRSEPHRARQAAESFGADPARYDRTRPRYPRALVERIINASPGPEVLDVGIGTGVSAEPFREAGCRVLGIEVDPRMAAFARSRGFAVDVARFEDWEPAARRFDAVIAGMTWHWIDPSAGAAKAAAVLRRAGHIAVFWNVQQPPVKMAAAFSEVYARVLPDTPFAAPPRHVSAAYDRILQTTTAGIRATEAFTEPEPWWVEWERPYTREQWLDQVPTFGGHSTFPDATLAELVRGLGAVIDAAGGAFTMRYTAVALTASLARRT